MPSSTFIDRRYALCDVAEAYRYAEQGHKQPKT
jgi:hypothetical protein